ncbi:unnamed protein product [Meganyctiphanes norvegica]|uniref:Innexin n=1 Tax=Meganyctiphanes norvegica TaxID=48144 RepID=A0AAV2QML1_MEGNR
MSVLAIISELGSLFKIHDRGTIVDSAVFRLHYRWTGSALFVASILVGASEFIGDPIQCIRNGEPASKPINTYCWIESTFTLHNYWYPDKDNDNIKIYGLGQENEDIERRTHYYYQWVPAVLFCMGVFFYLPHGIWKMTEKQIVDKLLQGIDSSQIVDDHTDKMNNITKYLKATHGLNLNWHFGLIYLMCEGLNLLNVSMQILVLDKFFGGLFKDYGSMALNYWFSDELFAQDPLEVAFPRLSKCHFYQFGGGGSLEKLDALCVLGQNIFNEKLFLGIWFWFVTLAIISLGSLIYESVRAYLPAWRIRIIEGYTRVPIEESTKTFVENLHTGDFCLVTLLARNLNMVTFRDILKNMVQYNNNNNVVPKGIELKETTSF